jgi:bifunctional aspartokinase / homoserine dehydrogenase 1
MTIPKKETAGPLARQQSFSPDRMNPHRHIPARHHNAGRKLLRVMKFGGTSVGDAACIERVAEIVGGAARASDLVVVVSAMRGVTNQLLAAGSQAEAGDFRAVTAILEGLRQQHNSAADTLVRAGAERGRIARDIEDLFRTCDRLCRGTLLLRELTPRTRDAVAGLGERLSILLVAGALAERGIPSIAIEATELVFTDSNHGCAEPLMELTRQRCRSRLQPLFQRGIVPVVTGFIGATTEGALTTLGRGGSDLSATVIGAAIDADDVIIWTDVDGLETADPRLVQNTKTIAEISCAEAAELAYFGANVLHPKTLRPVMPSGIPLWIRNTFAPELPGTKITPAGPPISAGVTALTAIRDVAAITIGGPALFEVQDVLGRALRAAASIRADVLLASQASAQNQICVLVPAAAAKIVVDALHHEFSHELAHESAEHVAVDTNIAIVTVVGRNLRSVPGMARRIFAALNRSDVELLALAQASSPNTFSFMVPKEEVSAALTSLHREFRLECPCEEATAADQPVACYQSCNLGQPVCGKDEQPALQE